MDKNGLPEKSFLDSVSYKTQVFDRSLNSIHLSKIQLSDVLFFNKVSTNDSSKYTNKSICTIQS